ncbi:type II toxin-antitoxin system death-on-curing family toxin [Longivirga aurantiaca]|uniref:Type II toxin-antitoxin system death-on-curing family toxin n=1 Tax=Longivirga aurantiaca TaxID=1837743 RepID=A0ABW1SZY6_9ACTN
MSGETRLLTTEDLVAIATRIGRGDPQVRDLGLLESAAARPGTSVFGDDAYPDIETKAAALLESLVRNHALIDGNKRLGWLALVLFLALNGHRLDVDDDEAYDLVIGVAEGRHEIASIVGVLRGWGVSS